MPSWILAIDFGTSYTVAASRIADRPPEVIEIGGERRVPSVVMVDSGGKVIVGRTADDLSGTHPGSTLRAIKNRIGDQTPVVLNGRPHEVVTLVSELLGAIYAEAERQMGSPPREVRLTHPAIWSRPRLNRLLEAATRAGLPNPALVPEPVAAALSFASEVGVAPGAHVVVYDLGGGTFDSAVVTARGGGFNIVGRPSGDQNIGGELFDELIVNHLGEQLPPDAWDAIQLGEEPLWQQVGATLRNEARRAKETLSGNTYADLIVPLPSGLQQIRLTRDEFDELVAPHITQTIELLERCVNDAGLDADQLAGIALVGGSSRSPIVEKMVRAAFPGVPVVRRGDPKTAVASGAARAVRSSANTAPAAGPTSSPSAGIGAPGSAPGSAQPAPSAQGSVPVAPTSQPSNPSQPFASTSHPPQAPAGPSSQPSHPSVPPPSVGPASTGPASTGPASFGPASVGPGSSPPAPLADAIPPGSTAKKRSKVPLLIGAALVAVLAIVAAVLIVGGGDDTAEAQPTRDELQSALFSIREVRAQFDTDWNALALTGPSDPFCPQFSLADPQRAADALWTSPTAADGSGTAFYESISSYATEDDAETAFRQEAQISQNCETSEGHVGATPVTYTLTDATRDAAVVGHDAVAVQFEARPKDDPDTVLIRGWIVEARMGSIIVGTQLNVFLREADAREVDDYYDTAKAAFDKVDAAF